MRRRRIVLPEIPRAKETRVVVRGNDGLHRILGRIEVTGAEDYPPRMDDVQFAGHVGSVRHAGTNARFVLYRECSPAEMERFSETFKPNQR